MVGGHQDCVCATSSRKAALGIDLMSHIKSFALSAAAATSVVLTLAPAHATVITQTLTIIPTIVSFGVTGASPTLSLFNVSLGTLTAVSVTTKASGSEVGTVTNTALTKGVLTAGFGGTGSPPSSYGAELKVTAPGNAALNTLFASKVASNKLGTGNTPFDVYVPVTTANSGGFILPGNSFNFNFANSGTGSATYSDGTSLAAFTGASSVLIDGAMAGSTYGGNTAGSSTSSLTATDGVTFTFTYTYTPTPPTGTPEPASLALLGMGLIGLGAAARRKRLG
jgi:hypothetical protein